MILFIHVVYVLQTCWYFVNLSASRYKEVQVCGAHSLSVHDSSHGVKVRVHPEKVAVCCSANTERWTIIQAHTDTYGQNKMTN